jgi:hypothetical protein
MLDLKNMDFTIHKFRTLCEVVASNYPTITMADYFEGNKPDKFILMRHDVDRMPGHALATAKIEHELGIRSTYYFRAIKNTFKPDIMKQIEAMGHEVGYHYEDLSVANGDHEKAIQLFASNLKEFREVCDIRTICMHGRPLSKHDNRDMWKKNDFKDFGLKGETYLSAGSDLNYFSDTGRTWGQKNSLRDFMPNKTEKLVANTTDDLSNLIKSGNINNFYILTHPERWSMNTSDWSLYYGMDMTVNIVKKGLRAVRK